MEEGLHSHSTKCCVHAIPIQVLLLLLTRAATYLLYRVTRYIYIRFARCQDTATFIRCARLYIPVLSVVLNTSKSVVPHPTIKQLDIKKCSYLKDNSLQKQTGNLINEVNHLETLAVIVSSTPGN